MEIYSIEILTQRQEAPGTLVWPIVHIAERQTSPSAAIAQESFAYNTRRSCQVTDRMPQNKLNEKAKINIPSCIIKTKYKIKVKL